MGILGTAGPVVETSIGMGVETVFLGMILGVAGISSSESLEISIVVSMGVATDLAMTLGVMTPAEVGVAVLFSLPLALTEEWRT